MKEHANFDQTILVPSEYSGVNVVYPRGMDGKEWTQYVEDAIEEFGDRLSKVAISYKDSCDGDYVNIRYQFNFIRRTVPRRR